MNIEILNSWANILADEFKAPYFSVLDNLISTERAQYSVYPQEDKVFNAFNCVPFEDVKVVIIGQDPYHGEGEAHGLSFSVPHGVKIPPSLKNIFKELKSDVGMEIPNHGCLEKWASQGVLLLNTTLTVRADMAGSHSKKGWGAFTNAVIRELSNRREGLVFILWGEFAKTKKELIDESRHFILESAHPSPLSARRGFFGCRHFSKTNEILVKQGLKPIDWNID